VEENIAALASGQLDDLPATLPPTPLEPHFFEDPVDNG